jgi:hypothetical protein
LLQLVWRNGLQQQQQQQLLLHVMDLSLFSKTLCMVLKSLERIGCSFQQQSPPAKSKKGFKKAIKIISEKGFLSCFIIYEGF